MLTTHDTLASDLAAVAESLRRVTARVMAAGGGTGSGIVWRPDGLVVTNAHVVRGGRRAPPDRARVELADGRTLGARLAAYDEGLDLAALVVEADRLPAARLAPAATLRAGQIVLAMGHALGLDRALAVGVVHSAERPEGGAPRWVRADVRLAPGNSGGPLADAAGRVVGVNSMIVGGLGVAVATEVVARFLGRAAGETTRAA